MASGYDYITVQGAVPQERGISTLNLSGPDDNDEGTITYRLAWNEMGFTGSGWLWEAGGNMIRTWWESNFSQFGNEYSKELSSFQTYVSSLGADGNLDAAFATWNDVDKFNWMQHQKEFGYDYDYETGQGSFTSPCVVIIM